MKTLNVAVTVVFLVMLSVLHSQCQTLWVLDWAAFERDQQLCLDTLMNSGLNNDTVSALTREFHVMRPFNMDLACSHAKEAADYRECREAAWRKNVADSAQGLVASPGAYGKALQLLCLNRDIDRSCISNTTLMMLVCKRSLQRRETDYSSVFDPAQTYCRLELAQMACLNTVLQSCPEKTRHVISQYNDIVMPPACRQLITTTLGPRHTTTLSGSGSNVISVTSVLLACTLAMTVG